MEVLGEIQSYTSFDGTTLATRFYEAQGFVRSRIVFLHGIISHAGWYAPSCDLFSKLGNEVHFLDRRGSGLNSEGRGDIDQWETWIRDVTHYIESLPNGPPILLMGISWGGKLVPVVVRRRPDLFAGFGMLCPGIYAKQQPGLPKRLAVKTAVGAGVTQKRVSVPLKTSDLFTDSPKWQEYIDNDPFTLRQITLRFASEDHKMTVVARESPSYIHKPALLTIAHRDKIVHNEKTIQYLHRMASASRTLFEYDAAHTLEFEPDPTPMIEDISGWAQAVAQQEIKNGGG